MARHSHWHNIQLSKGKADAKRAGVFAKLTKNIVVAAREGGGDPSYNFKLRMAVDAARAVSMPKDNIERAIARAVGGEGSALQETIYEGFAPGGVAIIIRCLTDNPTRTVAEVKTIASKNGGSIGAPGSVMWMFERKGVVHVADLSGVKDRDALELALIDAGASDIQPEVTPLSATGDGGIPRPAGRGNPEGGAGLKIICDPADLKKLTEAVEVQGLKADMSGFEYVAKTTMLPPAEDTERIAAFVERLEDNDDVDAVFTNEA